MNSPNASRRRRRGTTVEVLGQRLSVDGQAPATPEVDVLVRPEALHVAGHEHGDARVVATAYLGAATRLTVRLADGTEVKADLPTHQAATLGAGTAVQVSLPDRPVLVAEHARRPHHPPPARRQPSPT